MNYFPTFTDQIGQTNVQTFKVAPSTTLQSISTFTEIFRTYIALATIDVNNVIGTLALYNQIAALSMNASSQMWVDYRTVGETSYYLRLNYLSDIFSNQVPFLNLTPTQTSIMNKFFSTFSQTIFCQLPNSRAK